MKKVCNKTSFILLKIQRKKLKIGNGQGDLFEIGNKIDKKNLNFGKTTANLIKTTSVSTKKAFGRLK